MAVQTVVSPDQPFLLNLHIVLLIVYLISSWVFMIYLPIDVLIIERLVQVNIHIYFQIINHITILLQKHCRI